MFQTPPRVRPALSWALVAAWVLAIYATVPFAREIQRRADAEWGAGSLRTFSISVIALGASIAILHLARSARGVLACKRFIPLAGVCLLFFASIKRLADTPAEAVHFVQYGILSLLAFGAFAHRQRDPMVYLNAILLCALASLADEFIQWLLPGRYWDFRDVRNNIWAALLVQAAIAGGFQPPYINGRPAPQSIRIASMLASGFILALALCASNTPAFNARLAGTLPRMSWLLDQDHAMAEYGFRHEDPAIGRFYSRFTLDALAGLDRRRGEAVGAILRFYSTESDFTDFLQRYTPARDAFAHEAMVHFNRRNHYFAVLPKYRFEPEAYRFHLTVAFRENQILERYFPNTLAHAAPAWTVELKEALAGQLLAGPSYTSEVSAHVIHRFGLRHVWMATVLALALCGWVYHRCGREEARR